MGVAWFSGWDVIVRTLVAGSVTYLALVLLLRVSGPRTLAKWYAFDLIVTVALGSTFANGVLSKDIAVAQAVAGFVFLVALQYIIGTLAVRWQARGVEGRGRERARWCEKDRGQTTVKMRNAKGAFRILTVV